MKPGEDRNAGPRRNQTLADLALRPVMKPGEDRNLEVLAPVASLRPMLRPVMKPGEDRNSIDSYEYLWEHGLRPVMKPGEDRNVDKAGRQWEAGGCARS